MHELTNFDRMLSDWVAHRTLASAGALESAITAYGLQSMRGQLRRSRPRSFHRRESECTPAQLEQALTALTPDRRALCGLACLGLARGHLREAAAKTLVGLQGEAAATAAMLAADDHVLQVRRWGREAVALLGVRWLALRADLVSEEGLTEDRRLWRTQAQQALTTSEGIAALVGVALNGSDPVSSAALGLLVDAGQLTQERAATLARAASWRVRAAVARHVVTRSWTAEALLFAGDSQATVRKALLWACTRSDTVLWRPVLRTLANDVVPSVQRIAVWYFRDDAALVEEHTRRLATAESADERVHWLHSVSVLAPPVAREVAERWLGDSVVRVRRQALRVLVRSGGLSSAHYMQLGSEQSSAVRRDAVHLLRDDSGRLSELLGAWAAVDGARVLPAGRWGSMEQLPSLLLAVAEGEEWAQWALPQVLRTVVRSASTGWLVPPSTLERTVVAWEACGAAVSRADPDLAHAVERLLWSYRR